VGTQGSAFRGELRRGWLTYSKRKLSSGEWGKLRKRKRVISKKRKKRRCSGLSPSSESIS